MSKKIQLAIFPIPDMICFPGQLITLHVFEPRYRQMVKDCLKHKRELGICLPKKVIAEGKASSSSVKEILNSNRALFEVHEVMGAGPVQLIQELPDGRFLIEVEVYHRVELLEMKQELPYYHGVAKPIEDDLSLRGTKEESIRFDRLIELSKFCLEDQYSSFEEHVSPEVFADKNLTEFCFRIFDWCHLLPDHMQRALETTDPLERADHLIGALEVYIQALGLDPFEKPMKKKKKKPNGILVEVDFQKKKKLKPLDKPKDDRS